MSTHFISDFLVFLGPSQCILLSFFVFLVSWDSLVTFEHALTLRQTYLLLLRASVCEPERPIAALTVFLEHWTISCL